MPAAIKKWHQHAASNCFCDQVQNNHRCYQTEHGSAAKQSFKKIQHFSYCEELNQPRKRHGKNPPVSVLANRTDSRVVFMIVARGRRGLSQSEGEELGIQENLKSGYCRKSGAERKRQRNRSGDLT